jgi:hypothetical protein
MAVINVLYLPRDERLRTVVKTAIDFVEEVYRGEVLLEGFSLKVLSGLKFVSFNVDDEFDVHMVSITAYREGLDEVERTRKGEIVPKEPRLFYWPHYLPEKECAWVPVSVHRSPLRIHHNIAHETTHHVFYKLTFHSIRDALDIVFVLRRDLRDLGVDVDELIRKGEVRPDLLLDFNYIVHELVASYTTDNYFVNLEREPRTPTYATDIANYAKWAYRDLVTRPQRRPVHEVEALEAIHQILAHRDLQNFRAAVHELFMRRVTKKLPADVLESNRVKYEILYRGEPLTRLL